LLIKPIFKTKPYKNGIKQRIIRALSADAETCKAVQFERQGYFCLAPDSAPEKPVFNRTVALRDSWAKKNK
jgi:hypothetical protein